MILAPEQIAEFFNTRWNHGSIEQAMADTILAYADIVQRVAEIGTRGRCWFCGKATRLVMGDDNLIRGVIDHSPDCLYLAARRLRGLD